MEFVTKEDGEGTWMVGHTRLPEEDHMEYDYKQRRQQRTTTMISKTITMTTNEEDNYER